MESDQASAGAMPGLDPGIAFHYALSQARRALAEGEVEEAEDAFAQATAAIGDSAGYLATVNRVTLLCAMRRFTEARECVDTFLSQATDDSWLPPEILETLQSMEASVRDLVLRPVSHFPHYIAASMLDIVGRHAEAAQRLQQAEQVSGAGWWLRETDPWQVRALMAGVESRRPGGDPSRAEAWYEQAIGLFEETRAWGADDIERSSLTANRSANQIYREAALAVMLAGAHEPDECIRRAFGLLERARARALLDFAAANAALRERPLEVRKAVRRWHALRQVTASLWDRPAADPDLSAALAAQAEGERQLRDIWPDFLATENPTVAALDADQVQRALPEGAVLITYSTADDRLLVIAIRGGEYPVMQAVCPTIGWDVLPGVMAQWIKANRNVGCDSGIGNVAGAALAEWLLAPFDAMLATARAVIFVPDGLGLEAPLHTLPYRDAVLIDAVAVTYLPSASLLPQVSAPAGPAETGSALVVGDPIDMRRPDGSVARELPCAELEAKIVARLCSSVALTREDATTSNVLNQVAKAHIVHLATHGHLHAQDPARSVLLLAHGTNLTIEKLLTYDFKPGLVVLSACDSGIGRRTAGGEVMGLARILLAAGVRTVVVCLWPASDLTSQRLMHDFYRHLPDLGAARALAEAQRRVRHLRWHEQLREQKQARDWIVGQPSGDLSHFRPPPRNEKDTRHPRYWAPFVVIGAPD